MAMAISNFLHTGFSYPASLKNKLKYGFGYPAYELIKFKIQKICKQSRMKKSTKIKVVELKVIQFFHLYSFTALNNHFTLGLF
jgi:hypothetical protein